MTIVQAMQQAMLDKPLASPAELAKIMAGYLNVAPDTDLAPIIATGIGGSSDAGGSSTGKMVYPSDIVGLGVNAVGRGVQQYFKQKAAKQVARGNAPQHIAAALSTPNDLMGNPMQSLAKINADAGQAKAAESMAIGDFVGGTASDISTFINTINSMRRLASGNALGAGALMALQRWAKQGRE